LQKNNPLAILFIAIALTTILNPIPTGARQLSAKQSLSINTFYVSVKSHAKISETFLERISSYKVVFDFRSEFSAQQLKSIHSRNPKIKVIKYLNTGHIFPRMKDFKLIDKHRGGWFAKDSMGERVRVAKNRVYVMEPSNKGYQDWLITQAAAAISKGYDGIMADSFYYPLFPPYSDYYLSAPVSPRDGKKYNANSWMQSKNSLLNRIKHTLGKKLLVVNGYMSGRQYYRFGSGGLLKIADGVWVEAFTRWPKEGFRPVADWEKDIKMLKEVAASGKYTMLQTKFVKGAANTRPAAKLKLYAFSSYLLGAAKRSFFEFNTLDSRGWDGESITYPYYKKQLGRALGGYYKKGGTYHRNYAHARVVVNPSDHKSTIYFSKKGKAISH